MNRHGWSILSFVLAVLMVAGCGGGGGAQESAPDAGLLGAGAATTPVVARPELRYGDIVQLKSEYWENYLSGRSDDAVRTVDVPDEWERWTIVDPHRPGSTESVKFGDTVLFRSPTRGRFLSAQGDGNRGRVALAWPAAEWEQFKIVDPERTASVEPVMISARVQIYSPAKSTWLSGRGRGHTEWTPLPTRVADPALMMAAAQEWEQWHLQPYRMSANAYWMTELASDLRDVALTKAIIPGSHDAGTYSIADDARLSPDLPLDQMPAPVDDNFKALKQALDALPATLKDKIGYYMAQFARAQRGDLTSQLTTGVRYFDLRPGASEDGRQLLIVHSLYGGDILPMIDQVAEFLRTHPREIVILDFSHFTVMSGDDHAKLIAYIKQAFGAKLAPRPDGAGAGDPKANSYTFGKMWDNGWQVVALYHDDRANGEPKLWRYGTPQQTLWWPDKPTTDEVRTRLEDLLQNHRPALPEGSLFVLQSIVTGDAPLFAKVVVKLETPVEDLAYQLRTASDDLATFEERVAARQHDLDWINGQISSVQDQIDANQSWIDSHPYVWDYLGRKTREGWNAGLRVELAALQGTKSGYDDAVASARQSIASSRQKIDGLRREILDLQATPGSLIEMADRGNPAMLQWLSDWKRRYALNIVIQDDVNDAFVSRIRRLNKKNSCPGCNF